MIYLIKIFERVKLLLHLKPAASASGLKMKHQCWPFNIPNIMIFVFPVDSIIVILVNFYILLKLSFLVFWTTMWFSVEYERNLTRPWSRPRATNFTSSNTFRPTGLYLHISNVLNFVPLIARYCIYLNNRRLKKNSGRTFRLVLCHSLVKSVVLYILKIIYI